MGVKCKPIWLAVGVFLLLNLVGFNLLLYFSYQAINGISFAMDGKLSMDSLTRLPVIRKLVDLGKNGGFSSLNHETIERLFLVSHALPSHLQANGTAGSSISFMGIDVSHSGEASYIYRRILMKPHFPFRHLVVDIGANDGLMSSNSLNFIQWGWDAVLVEPIPRQLELAKKNTQRYRDPYNEGKQSIQYVQAVIAEKDGPADFVIADDVVSMESHVAVPHRKIKAGESVIKCPGMTVMTLTRKYNIPKRFAILSIDAEGVGDMILKQWMSLGFRPAYVVYESMHNKERPEQTYSYMHKYGYRYLTFRGWNHIFELRGK